MPENTKERLKDALKRYRTGIILRMLRDAGHLERRGEGRKDVRKNGDGTVKQLFIKEVANTFNLSERRLLELAF